MDAGPQSASPTRRLILLAAAGFGFTSLAVPAAATSAAMEEAVRQPLGASLRMPLEVPQFEPRETELP